MMTPKLQQTLTFIQSYLREHGYAPTVAEIAKGIHIKSTGVAHRYITALADEGYLHLIPGKRRNIELTELSKAASNEENFSLPLLGRIAAGQPIEAIPGVESIDLARMLLGNDRYVLKVSGDSMIEEGIFDGDLVVCAHATRANNGEIVVALIDDEAATLKRFYHDQKGNVILQPANANHAAMEFPAQRVKIQGVMIGLLRIAA